MGYGTPGGGPTAIAATASRRLSASLRVEERAHTGEQDEKDVSDSEDEAESRVYAARPVNARLRSSASHKRRQRAKPKIAKVTGKEGEGDEGHTIDGANDFGRGDNIWDQVDNADALVSNEVDGDLGRKYHNKLSFVEVGTAASLWKRSSWQHGVLEGVRKKKKIRSRQKNLRRDRRPRDQLPAHLNDETLARGRVKRKTSTNSIS